MKSFRLIQESSDRFDKIKQPEQWEADRLDYADAIRQVITAPLDVSAGVKLDEMEKGLRVLKALKDKKLDDIVELEDADWAHLCDKIRAARWGMVDERVVRFSHTILNATDEVLDLGGDSADTGRMDGDSGAVRARPLDPAAAANGRAKVHRASR